MSRRGSAAQSVEDDDDDASSSTSGEAAPVQQQRPDLRLPSLAHEPEERMWKIIVVGDAGVGKTAYLRRTVHGAFSLHYKSTIGVDFLTKKLTLRGGKVVVNCQLWDIAGQERFGSMTRVYFREARGAIVVCDNRVASFQSVRRWKEDIDQKVTLPDENRKIPCMLLVSKCDLTAEPDAPDNDALTAFAREAGFVGFMRVSAKTGQNCDLAIQRLIRYMYKINVDTKPPASHPVVAPLELKFPDDADAEQVVTKKRCEC